jgi:hypothetical protein
MSARFWSSSIRSPTRTCQATISASAMPSPMSGSLKAGEIGPFQAVRIRGVEAGDALHRRFQVIEAALLHQSGEFGAEAAGARRLVDDHAAAGLLHALLDRLDVERDQGSEVDDLGIDAGFLDHLLADVDHGAIG